MAEDPTRATRKWRHWACGAVEALLALFLLLTVCDKARNTANYVVTAAALIGLAMFFVRSRRGGLSRLRWAFVGGLLGFLALNMLAALLAEKFPNRGNFSYYRLHVPGVAIALAAGVGLRGRAAARRVLLTLLVAFGAWYVFEAASLPWRADSAFDGERLKGFRKYHMQFARELVVLCCLYLGCALAARHRWPGLASLAAALLSGALLYLTRARGALLSIALVSVPGVAFFQARFGTRKQRIIAVCLWFFLVVPAAGLAWWCLASPSRRSMDTLNSRLRAQKICAQIMARGPWYRVVIGHGRSSRIFPGAAAHYRTELPVSVGETMLHSHNVLSQTLIETGVLGVAALLLVWCVAAWAAFSAWHRGRGAAATIAGTLFVTLLTIAALSQVEYTLWKIGGRLTWLVVGLAFAWGVGGVEDAPPEAGRETESPGASGEVTGA